MRGSPAQPEERHEGLRIIPAHAGLTDVQSKLAVRYRDHLRACGAHVRVTAVNKPTSGSSPRMRGSHTGYDGIVLHVGIIPAHAGLTTSLWFSGSARRDHPRACGAHIARPSGVDVSKGSSPRMRGSPNRAGDVKTRHGIIPAHAGLTLHPWRRRYPRRDHPRACGAHKVVARSPALVQGSSPRMRGSQERGRGGRQ